MENIYIIIPAYNEEENIVSVAREWHEVVSKIGGDSKLVIIDDGSKDSTYQKLCNLKEELPYLVPITKENSGHGATLLFGYEYALKNNASFIFQTDSDGQTLPSEFWNFWNLRNTYSVIIGHRKKRQDGLSRIFVTKVLKYVLKVIFHMNIPDANTPFRLMSHEVLKKHISYIPKNFNLSNILLTVSFTYHKESIKYIPITFKPRQGGINSINLKRIFKIGLKSLKDFRNFKSTHMSGHSYQRLNPPL